LLPEADRARHGEHVSRYHQAAVPRPLGTHGRFRALHRDGYSMPVDIMLSPQTVGEGLLTLCVIRDLSAQRALETRLSHSEQQYRHLIEQATDVFYSIDVDADPLRGTLTYVSPQVRALTGYPAEMFLENHDLWLQLVHPTDVQVGATAATAIANSGAAGTREYRLRHRDDGRYTWVEDRVVPRYDAAGRLIGLHGTARDINERWWLHHRLRTMVTLGAALRDRRGRHDLRARRRL